MGFDIYSLLLYGVLCALLMLAGLCGALIWTSSPYPVAYHSEEEKYFKESGSGKLVKFPSLDDAHSVHLSVVVPAYEEEKRLPPMLDECLQFLNARQEVRKDFKYEVIVVSDGSKDKTVHVAQEYSEKYGSEKVRVLELRQNRGKGGAVRLGMQSARGAVLLFADADGATKFADLVKLENSLIELVGSDYVKDSELVSLKEAIVCGSRAHLEEEAIASRSYFRTLLMYGFHFLVWSFAVRDIRDTQCGFKLFTRQAARACFTSMHVERWAFDVEVLYIAQRLRIPVDEVSVNWTEIEGSKIVPVWSWLQMGKDLILIWLRYTIGAWKLSIKSD